MPLTPAQEVRLAAFLRTSLVQGELSASRVRLWALGLTALNECVWLLSNPEQRGALSAWVPSLVLLAGAFASAAHLAWITASARRNGPVGASVGLDALLILAVGAAAALAPLPAYHGALHHPTTPFVLIAIAASALRLSRGVVRLSTACNGLGLALLLAIDARHGWMPTVEEATLWSAAVVAAALIADAAAVRARQLAIDGALALNT